MSQPTTIRVTPHPASELTPVRALRLAWLCWLGLLVVPFTLVLFLIWNWSPGPTTGTQAGWEKWFIGSMVYVALSVSASLFWRGHVFKPYWAGRPVAPGDYLWGMVAVWTALAVAGIVSLIGCFVTGSLAPNLIPAAMSLFLYLTMWPGGKAMVGGVGNADDSEVYTEPN
ncbi:MAG: hypothetical protein ABSF29_01710 [Tepidisphaeraceae bacterium]|jgi:hypothetical protein